MMSGSRRIFQIGLNRCGTTSLHEFFKSNGISSLHWEGGRLATSFFARMQRNEDPFLDYPGVTFFSDMEAFVAPQKEMLEAYKHFEYMFSFYPDSYYILNTRPCDHWLASRWNHIETRQTYLACLGLDRSGLMEYWRRERDAHHGRVMEFFRGNGGKLLVFDIEQDPPEKLSAFLAGDFHLDASLYGRHNATYRPPFVRGLYWRLVRLAKRLRTLGT